MQTNQILQADVLDIIFENRNKMYGAYDLRKTYNKRLTIAVTVMIGCCLFAILVSVAGKSREHTHAVLEVSDVVNLGKVQQQKPPVIPPVQLKMAKPVATKKFTTIKLTNAPIETPPPVQADMDNIAIGKIDAKGAMSDVVAPPAEEQGITKEAPQVIEVYTKEFKTVQIQAQFPGGEEAWRKFLERNLRADLPTENGAPAGTYTVEVSFLVDRDGNISEVQALDDPGYGTAAEAVRVIKSGPQWKAAVQNGRPVIYRQKQAITFKVEEAQ